ncbi:MAG: NAD(P)/FAD-dependent oxidoreductase [Cyclobacteriaceae bacterium]
MRTKTLIVNPEIGMKEDALEGYLKKHHLLSEEEFFRINRRSIDARKRQVKINLEVSIDSAPIGIEFVEYQGSQQDVSKATPVIIVGAGPAGMFAAIKAIELGFKPIILERGKDVRARRRDLADINKKEIVNPDSNYCFGEGGAGTYSDGKLYTRSKKRGSVRRVYEILVAHGANEKILYESHPHIGTNKLPQLVAELRETILSHGGEIHFETRVTGLIKNGNQLQGVEDTKGEKYIGTGVILATGHSARDIFRLLQKEQVLIEAKPFALGVRIEHPQQLIDQIQYHCDARDPFLPASSYSLVHKTYIGSVQRGVFSFCMCPGGFIVPAATAPGELVVNGMSPSRRDSRFANSGIVAAVALEDIPREFHQFKDLAAMEFQAAVEQQAWRMGGCTQHAPAQRMTDFLRGKISQNLPHTSYQPGLTESKMEEALPDFIASRLKQGFKGFGQKMKGYVSEEAQLIGVESRTSSPVRIPRDSEKLEHPQLKGLFPCGEGAGYAGGIVSAAMDGERVMEKLAVLYSSK